MNYLVISPQAGMCNRLRAICSAVVLAKKLNRKLYLAWQIELDLNYTSTLAGVRAMQNCTFETLFCETEAIQSIPMHHKIDICFSEWLSGHYWYQYQSTAYRNLANNCPIQQIGEHADILLDRQEKTILVETSHIVRLSTVSAVEWDAEMSMIYAKYFVPQPKYTQRLPNRTRIGISIRRGELLDYVPAARQSPAKIVEWLQKFHWQDSLLIFSDDHAVRDQVRKQLGSCNDLILSQELQAWERGFLEFIALAHCCSVVYGTPGSSFAQEAAKFGKIPYMPIPVIQDF